MELCVGIDIGNAKTEIAYMEDGNLVFVRQPSVVNRLSMKPDANDNSPDFLMDNLFDNLTVQTFSKGLDHDGLFFIGKRALSSPDTVLNMPISVGSKSLSDIPILMSLSMLSGIGLKRHFKTTNKVPKTLTVKVKMATAIPSSEYTKDAARHLENRFLGEHTINMFFGDHNVLVTIEVTDCKVTEEGKTAMLAFLNSDASILRHYNEAYDKKLVPEDFSDALSLHADIGDGTSEIVYTNGYNPVQGGSEGLRVGVGHATKTAIELYKKVLSNNTGDISRQHFMQLLQKKNEKAKIANEQMKNATMAQSLKILDKIKDGFATITSSEADFFFVHGGGSITFKDDLYEDLVKFASSVKAEVVWIPAEFATQMNSKGTFYLAQFLFCNKD